MSQLTVGVASAVVAAALPALVCAAGGEKTSSDHTLLRDAFGRSRYSAALRKYWEDSYSAADAGKSVCKGKPPYPTERAIAFLSAWQCTGEERYRQVGIMILDFAHSCENEDHLLVSDNGFNRDLQARQIYNFYTAYKVLGDTKYLAWADQCARGMLDHLDRRRHEANGKTFTTFVADYCSPGKPYDCSSLNPWVDVNQNSEVALAYSLLCFEPKSAFYKSSDAKDVAHSEMNAALSVVDPTGAIPLAEGEEYARQFDTLYGSYALFSWVWLNSYWKNPDWQKAIDLSGRWIAGFSTGKGKVADRYYPKRADYLSAGDMWYRIPVLNRIGFAPYGMIDYYVADVAPHYAPEENGFLMFAYNDLMGIDPRFYLPE